MAAGSAWLPGEKIPASLVESREPAIAMVGETLHLVWNSNNALYHAWRTAEGWGRPTRITIGEQPALYATAAGQLHCLFVNQFFRNYDIYHIWWDGRNWSLPVNASRTYGASTQPALAIGPDGSLHAAWSDNTPGYSTIYYGTLRSAFWANRPIPSGRGSSPTIGVSSHGEVFAAWQDRRSDTGKTDIFCTTLFGDAWSVPESVSDSAQADSLLPKLAVSARGDCHLLWQEESGDVYRVFHADRRPNGWSIPADVSGENADCRLARIAANPVGYMHAVWQSGEAFTFRARSAEFDSPWRSPETAASGCDEPADLSITVSGARKTHLVWSALDENQARRLYYTKRDPFPKYTVTLPLIRG